MKTVKKLSRALAAVAVNICVIGSVAFAADMPRTTAPQPLKVAPITPTTSTGNLPDFQVKEASVNGKSADIVEVPPGATANLKCVWKQIGEIIGKGIRVKMYVGTDLVMSPGYASMGANFEKTEEFAYKNAGTAAVQTFKCAIEHVDNFQEASLANNTREVKFRMNHFFVKQCAASLKIKSVVDTNYLKSQIESGGQIMHVDLPGQKEQTLNLKASQIEPDGNKIKCSYGDGGGNTIGSITVGIPCKYAVAEAASQGQQAQKYACTP